MDIYKEYASLKAKKESIEEEIAKINEAIVDDMKTRKVTKEESKWGKFTICAKKTFKYSAKVTKLEDSIKMLKFEEQEKGIAKAKESHYLLFKTNETNI